MTFEEFYAAERDRVVRALGLMVSPTTLAEDAAAEAFAKAWTRWERVSKMEQPRAWVVTVGLRWARRAWRRAAMGAQLERAAGSAVVGHDHSTLDFQDALSSLPPRQRTVVVLRYYLDLSIRETARLTRTSDGNVKRLSHDALERLRSPGTLATTEN